METPLRPIIKNILVLFFAYIFLVNDKLHTSDSLISKLLASSTYETAVSGHLINAVNQTQANMSKTMQNIATGVLSGQNAGELSRIQSLRQDLSAIQQTLQALTLAKGMTSTAVNGMSTIKDLIGQLKNIAERFDIETIDRRIAALGFDEMITQIDEIAKENSFNKITLLDGLLPLHTGHTGKIFSLKNFTPLCALPLNIEITNCTTGFHGLKIRGGALGLIRASFCTAIKEALNSILPALKSLSPNQDLSQITLQLIINTLERITDEFASGASVNIAANKLLDYCNMPPSFITALGAFAQLLPDTSPYSSQSGQTQYNIVNAQIAAASNTLSLISSYLSTLSSVFQTNGNTIEAEALQSAARDANKFIAAPLNTILLMQFHKAFEQIVGFMGWIGNYQKIIEDIDKGLNSRQVTLEKALSQLVSTDLPTETTKLANQQLQQQWQLSMLAQANKSPMSALAMLEKRMK